METVDQNLLAPPFYLVVLWFALWIGVLLLVVRWWRRRRRVTENRIATEARIERLERQMGDVADNVATLAESARFTTAVLTNRTLGAERESKSEN